MHLIEIETVNLPIEANVPLYVIKLLKSEAIIFNDSEFYTKKTIIGERRKETAVINWTKSIVNPCLINAHR